jgi:hypothetical protein
MLLTLAIIATILFVLGFIGDIFQSIMRAENDPDDAPEKFIGRLIGSFLRLAILSTIVWVLFVF